ncbi:hypothetical protein OG21DRAFT_1089207 [Imleria badia]|nr:hypothetical protein OG21DRAFT_1089207 [Imleria badia]
MYRYPAFLKVICIPNRHTCATIALLHSFPLYVNCHMYIVSPFRISPGLTMRESKHKPGRMWRRMSTH